MTAPQLDHCPACGHGFRRSKSAHFCREAPMLAAIPYRGDLEGTVLRDGQKYRIVRPAS